VGTAIEELPGGLRLRPGGAPLGTDTMLLADFARTRPGETICDLGCGGGALSLLLCAKDASCRVTGVELDPASCAAAAENFAQAVLNGRCRLVPGDLGSIRSLLPAGGFSMAVANPPYFPVSAPSSPDAARADARTETRCTLDVLCGAAAWVLRNRGRFFLVYRAARLCDLLLALRAGGLEPKRLRLARHRPGAAAKLVLIEARKGGGTGLRFEPELLLYDADGAPTPDFRRIYHLQGGA